MNRTEVIKFKEGEIHTAYDLSGNIRLSLNDLCDILKRGDLIRNGEAVRLCPSSLKIQFRKNGKETWSISPADVQILIRLSWKESHLPHSFLNELETWTNGLLESESRTPLYVSDPVTFHFKDDFPVSYQIRGERIMVNATQITMQYGKLPSEWLRIVSTDKLRREMEKSGITGKYDYQIFTTRGRGNGSTWLEYPLAIALTEWISSKDELSEWCKDCIRKIKTHGAPGPIVKKPVIKSAPVTLQLNGTTPGNLEEAIQMITALRIKIEEDAPKVLFFEEYIENRDSFKSTRIADELKTSPHLLHKFLYEEGICKYENKRWVVFSSYRAWQCDIPYAWTDGHGKTYIFGSSKRWTHIGRENIIELWKQKHPESQI